MSPSPISRECGFCLVLAVRRLGGSRRPFAPFHLVLIAAGDTFWFLIVRVLVARKLTYVCYVCRLTDWKGTGNGHFILFVEGLFLEIVHLFVCLCTLTSGSGNGGHLTS